MGGEGARGEGGGGFYPHSRCSFVTGITLFVVILCFLVLVLLVLVRLRELLRLVPFTHSEPGVRFCVWRQLVSFAITYYAQLMMLCLSPAVQANTRTPPCTLDRSPWGW